MHGAQYVLPQLQLFFWFRRKATGSSLLLSLVLVSPVSPSWSGLFDFLFKLNLIFFSFMFIFQVQIQVFNMCRLLLNSFFVPSDSRNTCSFPKQIWLGSKKSASLDRIYLGPESYCHWWWYHQWQWKCVVASLLQDQQISRKHYFINCGTHLITYWL
jgi:hypothetical protein